MSPHPRAALSPELSVIEQRIESLRMTSGQDEVLAEEFEGRPIAWALAAEEVPLDVPSSVSAAYVSTWSRLMDRLRRAEPTASPRSRGTGSCEAAGSLH
jgi:hypothetical protein